MFKTRVTEILGIKYPITQGAMGEPARAELASAVSNAGGLGVISALYHPTIEEFRKEIRKTKSMTDKPFAVNFSLVPTERKLTIEEYFNAAIDEGVNIIETAGRSPEPYIKLLKDAGVKVIHKVATVRHAKTAEHLGVDIVTIMSTEAAGHAGTADLTTLVQIPAAVDELKIPVIAAGGITDARGFVAALALGAEGVLMGTRFMLSKECNIHPKIKEWFLELRETDTMIVLRSINYPGRVARTDFTQKMLEMEEKGATPEELLPLMSVDRRRYAHRTGDINSGMILLGQGVGLIHDISSAKEIIEGIISEAKLIMQRLHKIGVDA